MISFVDVIYFTSNFPMVPASQGTNVGSPGSIGRIGEIITTTFQSNENTQIPLETGWPLSHGNRRIYLPGKKSVHTVENYNKLFKHQPIKTNCFFLPLKPQGLEKLDFLQGISIGFFCFGWSFQLPNCWDVLCPYGLKGQFLCRSNLHVTANSVKLGPLGCTEQTWRRINTLAFGSIYVSLWPK